MSDLFGNHIVGFSTRWLICCVQGISSNFKLLWKIIHFQLKIALIPFCDVPKLYNMHTALNNIDLTLSVLPFIFSVIMPTPEIFPGLLLYQCWFYDSCSESIL